MNEQTLVDALGVIVAAAGVVVALAAVVVSIAVASAQHRQVVRSERTRLRKALREWFGGLSHSAPVEVLGRHRVLDSQIKEDIHAVGRHEISNLMNWALMIHKTTWELEDAPKASQQVKDDAHARRMYAKWIFRDLLAEWELRPARTTVKIWWLKHCGYNAVGRIPIPQPGSLAESMRPFDSSRGPEDQEEVEQVQQRAIDSKRGWKKLWRSDSK